MGEEKLEGLRSGHEGPVWRILVSTWWLPSGMTHELRERQLRDVDRSGGTQPAHLRLIYRRPLPLLPWPKPFPLQGGNDG
jgi:hypothetical protein